MRELCDLGDATIVMLVATLGPPAMPELTAPQVWDPKKQRNPTKEVSSALCILKKTHLLFLSNFLNLWEQNENHYIAIQLWKKLDPCVHW